MAFYTKMTKKIDVWKFSKKKGRFIYLYSTEVHMTLHRAIKADGNFLKGNTIESNKCRGGLGAFDRKGRLYIYRFDMEHRWQQRNPGTRPPHYNLPDPNSEYWGAMYNPNIEE